QPNRQAQALTVGALGRWSRLRSRHRPDPSLSLPQHHRCRRWRRRVHAADGSTLERERWTPRGLRPGPFLGDATEGGQLPLRRLVTVAESSIFALLGDPLRARRPHRATPPQVLDPADVASRNRLTAARADQVTP